jgi:hypothetical protein
VLERLVAHDVHVDEEGVRVDAVRDRVVELAGEVELHAMGEVAAVGELEAQDGVAGRRILLAFGSREDVERLRACGTLADPAPNKARAARKGDA